MEGTPDAVELSDGTWLGDFSSVANCDDTQLVYWLSGQWEEFHRLIDSQLACEVSKRIKRAEPEIIDHYLS